MAHRLAREDALLREVTRDELQNTAETLFLQGLVHLFSPLNDLPPESLRQAVEAGLAEQSRLAGMEVFPWSKGKVKELEKPGVALIRLFADGKLLPDVAYHVWFDRHPVFKDQRAAFVRRVQRR